MGVQQGRIDRASAMGATVWPDGTGFRTWAPNARAVAVVTGARLGQIPDPAWRPDSEDQLAPLGDGSWGGFLAGAQAQDGTPYMFFVEGAGSAGWKRDSCARELTLAPAFPDSFCIVRDPASYPWHDRGWRPPAFNDLVIYQLHIGTWWAVDGMGRDIRTQQDGTLLDAVEKLGHLRALGVTAIQLLPVQEFTTAFSLGYNGVDYYSPEGRYTVAPDEIGGRLQGINGLLASFGQPALTEAQLAPGINQLKCLIDLCHLHGIAVILDLVYNHAGGGFDDRSLWFYDRQANGNLNNSLFFTDQGWAGGEIFAYWNQWVAQFLIDNARFYLNEYRIDGIRYDEVRVIENNGGREVCQHLTETVRATNPAAIQIAEYWNPDRPSAILPPPGGLGFDAELGDGLRDALRGLLGQAAGGAGARIDLSAVAAALTAPAGFPNAWRAVQFLENQDLTYARHDGAARVPMLADASDRRSWYARSRSRVVSALLLTAPGIPSLFMGQEFLEDKDWSDDPAAGDLIWWAGLDGPDPAMRDFLRFMTDLVRLRRGHPALRAEGVRVSRAENDDRILVLHRWAPGQGNDLVVIASLDETAKHGYAVGLPYAGNWRELFNSDFYDNFPNPAVIGNGGSVQALDGALDGFAASAALTLPANGVIVLGRP
ncbi:MAG TPA: alpha amylase C-terminal domain-containing protein [Aliidongia sp.]|nr:alpha amylase C-terminal domain-containing protein [Aliidongia sp.]